MRYIKTERLGVIETDKIITKDIGWIFREQPIIDVGLDAIIEEVSDDAPTGRFLAVQIKTGLGNFYTTDKALTHYVSHIHYNYWLNLSIPIILVAHLPDQNETYWQEINESNLKKKWKIEIPFSQKLNAKSRERFNSLLSSHIETNFKLYDDQEQDDDDDDFSIMEDVKCIHEATNSINRITEITKNQTDITNQLSDKIKAFTDSGISITSPPVSASIKGFANSLMITSKRMENEIDLFSHLYSRGIFTFEKIILRLHLQGMKLNDLDIYNKSISNVLPMLEYAISSFSNLKKTASEFSLNNAAFKEAKKQYVEILDLFCSELMAAKSLTENLVEKINNL